MTDAAPFDPADRARRMWRAYSGGRIDGEVQADPDRGVARCRAFRPPTPASPEFPSLVDPSLVWLTLEVAPPGETIAVLEWGEDGVRVSVGAGIPAKARPGFEALARMIVFDAARIDPPRIGHMDVGRGAWEQVAYSAEASACGSCPFARASNLDCPECRQVVVDRKTFAQWSRARIAEGLQALDFAPDLARLVALEVGFALSQVRAPMFSRDFFDQWAQRFAARTRDIFANEEDLGIARERIEAQMVQPWFRPPPFAERALPLPPPFADADVGPRARRKLRELVEAGVPRWQAEHHVRASVTLRQLLAAEGELLAERLGGVAQVRGTLDRLTLAIGDDGEEPWIVEVATAVGRAVELRRGLPEEEQARLVAEVERTHRELMAAVSQERRAEAEAEAEVDDARAIARALAGLRGASGTKEEEQP